jgi:outer membrane protein assembly factor BamB
MEKMNNKLFRIIILMLLVSVFASGCTTGVGAASSWPGATTAENVGYFSYGTRVYALNIKNGSIIWEYPQEVDSKRQFYAAPALDTDQVVVGDYSNVLTSLNRESGTTKWEFADAEDRYVGSALVANGNIYAPNSDHYFYALNGNGDLLWKFKAKGPNWTKPVADENYVYLASMDHSLYAFQHTYESANLVLDSDNTKSLVKEPVWSLDLGAAVVADPVIVNGILYTGTIDGTVIAVDLAKQAIAWSFDDGDTLGSIWGTPVVSEEAVFFGDEKGNVYALSVADGSALWSSPYAAGSKVISSGVAIDGSVVFATTEGRIFSINKDEEPKPLVTLDSAVYTNLHYADGKIIIAPASKESLFKAIDNNGNEIWNFVPAE